MAALKPSEKAFIIQRLACYETPSQVADAVRQAFGLSISRQQVESHDPTKASGRTLAKKWIAMFSETRARFHREISDIPIANRAYRLRVLDRMAVDAEKMKNIGMTAQLLEQAAKEVGDVYTNRQKLEHAGQAVQSLSTLMDELAKEQP